MTTQHAPTVPTTFDPSAPSGNRQRHARPIVRIAAVVLTGIAVGTAVHVVTTDRSRSVVTIRPDESVAIVFSSAAQTAGDRALPAWNPALDVVFSTTGATAAGRDADEAVSRSYRNPGLDLMLGSNWPVSAGTAGTVDGQTALLELVFRPSWA